MVNDVPICGFAPELYVIAIFITSNLFPEEPLALWGTGLFAKVNGHTYFLHEGRARNLAEAILWHRGEADASREAFRTAPATDREDLITYLESL